MDEPNSEKLFGAWETWQNVTRKKASTVFYYSELVILPAKYVIMKERLPFMKYISDEPRETLIREVFEVQRNDSRKG